jgi:aminomethyltransferase
VPYKSPLEPILRARGAVYGRVGDAEVPLHFGDPAAEIEALRTGPAAVDLGWRALVEVTGRDRVRFVHGMCTQDVKGMAPGQGRAAAAVTRQGKMVADLVVRMHPDCLSLETDRAALPALLETFTKFIVADDVRLDVSSRTAIGRYGPGTAPALPARPFDWTELEDGSWVCKDPTLGVEGYVRWTPPEATPAFGGERWVGFQAWETLRIENGFPRWGADMGPDVLPMEAGLEPIAISYSKGCYVGQEVIQRVKTYSEPPKMLVQLEVTGAQPGERILAGGQDIGHVTSAAPRVALGYVRKEFKNPGTEVSVGSRRAVVRALPWQVRGATA